MLASPARPTLMLQEKYETLRIPSTKIGPSRTLPTSYIIFFRHPTYPLHHRCPMPPFVLADPSRLFPLSTFETASGEISLSRYFRLTSKQHVEFPNHAFKVFELLVDFGDVILEDEDFVFEFSLEVCEISGRFGSEVIAV